MNAQGDKTDDNSNKEDNEDADVEIDTENSKNGPKRRILTAKREKKSSQRAEANTSGTEAVLKAVKELQLSIDKKFDEMKQENQSVVKQLQEQIGQVRVEFNNRMDGLSKKVESKVTQNVKKNIDDKFKSVKKDMESEMSRVKKQLKDTEKDIARVKETIIPTVNERLGDQIDELRNKVNDIQAKI